MTAPSLLILGTDVVLAATPATPVQLAHACLAAGYHTVIPATWGDELIASRTLDRLRGATVPLVQCSCPLVSRRLAPHGESIAPMLLTFVPPPVATARYLRAVLAPTRPKITFAGGCAGGGDAAIDTWISIEDLLAQLVERGIDLNGQPTEFDSVLPPDRRRFYSEPGGIPTRSALQHLPSPVEFLELGEVDLVVELGQRLLSPSLALLDVAPALGCNCVGSAAGARADVARARIRAMEPPRSSAPIVDHSLELEIETPSVTVTPIDVASRGTAGAPSPAPVSPEPTAPPASSISQPMAGEPQPEADLVAVETLPRRTPQGLSRPVLGTMPHARTDAGRQLPRAYVARRRSSPRGLRQSSIRGAHRESGSETLANGTKWFVMAGAGVAVGLIIAWILLAF